MFEKEAEDNKPPYAYCSLNTNCELWKDGFQKGAEFGYNKAKEEMQEQGLALQSDMDKTIEQNIQLKKQIEKMKCCQNCKFEDNDCIEEPCSACTRCLGNIKRKGNSDKWEIREK